MSAADQAKKLKAQFGDLISELTEFRGEVSLKITDAERIVEVCAFAKKELGFDYLVDVSSLDERTAGRGFLQTRAAGRRALRHRTRRQGFD